MTEPRSKPAFSLKCRSGAVANKLAVTLALNLIETEVTSSRCGLFEVVKVGGKLVVCDTKLITVPFDV